MTPATRFNSATMYRDSRTDAAWARSSSRRWRASSPGASTTSTGVAAKVGRGGSRRRAAGSRRRGVSGIRPSVAKAIMGRKARAPALTRKAVAAKMGVRGPVVQRPSTPPCHGGDRRFESARGRHNPLAQIQPQRVIPGLSPSRATTPAREPCKVCKPCEVGIHRPHRLHRPGAGLEGLRRADSRARGYFCGSRGRAEWCRASGRGLQPATRDRIGLQVPSSPRRHLSRDGSRRNDGRYHTSTLHWPSCREVGTADRVLCRVRATSCVPSRPLSSGARWRAGRGRPAFRRSPTTRPWTEA